MSKTIVLGQPPDTFEAQVDFVLPGGETASITLTFRYQTRTAILAMMKNMDDALAELSGLEDTSAMLEQSMTLNVDSLLQVVAGWDLDAEFNARHVRQLCDEYPMAPDAILTRYSRVMLEAQRGN
ncbi:phage tail assembly chaperone [Vibrio coralliilyticus]|uniref:phage tail assembly chaperone n=1 Tax=Vibrio coralliilyticus TaxID=190893 RepID=UPI0017932AD6|nr:phage tail assembly chaperone [Vibrio coralliilyticus]NUW66959.1 hypothetical protein [Vibrio coralliilyticus]NUW69153.1 hypothetical protein [Vibrio coralliilyticus]